MNRFDKFMRKYPGFALILGLVVGFGFAAFLFAKTTGSAA